MTGLNGKRLTALFKTRRRLIEENLSLQRQLDDARALIRGHLEEIAEIQRKLLPTGNSGISGIELATSYIPFVGAGGDYYDLVPLKATAEDPDQDNMQRWGVIIADVSGHGPGAAVETAMLDTILRTYPLLSYSPAELFTYANRHFFSRQFRGNFITAFVANYNPWTASLCYANAGHNPPVLKRSADGAVPEILEASKGIPLGVSRDYQWEDQDIPMHRGDALVLYTDGITESSSPQSETFGLSGLKAAVAKSGCAPQDIVNNVISAVDRHRGNAPPRDDQTLLAIQVTATACRT